MRYIDKPQSFKEYHNLSEYTVQSTSDYVFDTLSGGYGDTKIPISGTMFKRIWPDTIRSTVFHTTDLKGLNNLKRAEGTKKTISAFYSMMSRYMEKGVATEGGLVVEMDADVLVSASTDIMSQVDKQGRRWVAMEWFANAQRWGPTTAFNKVEKDLSKMIETLTKKYAPEEYKNMDKSSGDSHWLVWSDMKSHLHGDGRKLRLVIKDYFDGVEKILKRHKKTMAQIFYSYAKSKRSTEDSWDEQLVNNIKVKKVHVLHVSGTFEDEDMVYHSSVEKVSSWPIKKWESSIDLEVYTRKVVAREIGRKVPSEPSKRNIAY